VFAGSGNMVVRARTQVPRCARDETVVSQRYT